MNPMPTRVQAAPRDVDVRPGEQGGDQQAAGRVGQAQAEQGPDREEQADRGQVRERGDQQRAPLAERHRDRVDALATVEVEVEDRVDHVEAADPQPHGQEQQHRRQRDAARHRDPGGGRREAVGQAQRVVAEPGEALGVGIDDEGRDDDRPQVAAGRRQEERGQHEHAERGGREGHDLGAREAAGGQLALRRARVAGVDAGVDQAVQGHGGAARRHHGDRDPDERLPRRDALLGEHRAGVGEGQGVDAVLDLDEPGEQGRAHGGARGAMRTPCGQRRPYLKRRPSSDQRASTRALTAGSMASSSGHARGWPSSGQALVASMPILAP